MLASSRSLVFQQNSRYVFHSWNLCALIFGSMSLNFCYFCAVRTSRFRILLGLVMSNSRSGLRVLHTLMVLSQVYVAFLVFLIISHDSLSYLLEFPANVLIFCLAFTVQYEPELFPGLIYRMKQPKIVLLIFVSGKIVLTGAKVSSQFLCLLLS